MIRTPAMAPTPTDASDATGATGPIAPTAPTSPSTPIARPAPGRAVHRLTTAQATIATPLGPLLLARTPLGLAGAWFAAQKHHPGALAAPQSPDDPLLREAAAQFTGYFAGRRAVFELPLDLHGTPFQRAVWSALVGIAAGSTRSYAEVARQIGSPAALRAVGAAIGRNPLSIIVPCHRVIGSGGALTGYAGGLDRKIALMQLETSLR